MFGPEISIVHYAVDAARKRHEAEKEMHRLECEHIASLPEEEQPAAWEAKRIRDEKLAQFKIDERRHQEIVSAIRSTRGGSSCAGVGAAGFIFGLAIGS